VSRYLDMLGDHAPDQTTREAAAKTIMGFAEPAVSKHAARDRKRAATTSDEDGDV
jgi:hypothetical protein